jgi:hypothetical protein
MLKLGQLAVSHPSNATILFQSFFMLTTIQPCSTYIAWLNVPIPVSEQTLGGAC